MWCKQCSIVVSDSLISCPSCGSKDFYRDPKLVQALVNKDTNAILASKEVMEEVAGSVAEAMLAPIQEVVDTYITAAREGIVTYETVYGALETGHVGQNPDNNRFVRSLGMYYVAYNAWSRYNKFLYASCDTTGLFSAFHMLSTGNLCPLLDTAGFDRKMSELVLSYPSLKQWLAGCILTMLFMDILRKDVLEKVDDDDFSAVNHAFGEGFWEKQGVFANEANPYRTRAVSNKEAMQQFMQANNTSIGEDQHEAIERAVLQEIVVGLRAHQLSLEDTKSISRFLLKNISGITKQYELIALVGQLKLNWKALSNLTV